MATLTYLRAQGGSIDLEVISGGGTDDLTLVEKLLRLHREPLEARAGPPPPAALPYDGLNRTDGDLLRGRGRGWGWD